MVIKFIKNHPLLTYFILAYLISWGIAFPLVAQTQGWLRTSVPFPLHYLTAYGPLLSALIITAFTQGAKGVNKFITGLYQWRGISLGLWLATFSPLLIFILFLLLIPAFGGKTPDLRQIGLVNFLPDLGFGALILWTVTSGLGEEAGWRGFALPMLQKGRSALSASIILSVFWAGWHIPAFFYLPNYMAISIYVLPMFFIGLLSGSILLTWLYNSSKGLTLTAILWHGMFNFVTASKISDGIPAAIISTAVIVWAVLIVIIYKPKNLSKLSKHDII